MPTLDDGSRLSERPATLLVALVEADVPEVRTGQRQRFVFVTTGGGAGTSVLHHGFSDGETRVDLGDLQDLEELGLVDVQYEWTNQGSFRVTGQGAAAVAYLREQAEAVASQPVTPSDSATLGVDWATEVLPVLTAVSELFPTAPAHRGVSQDAINDRLGREPNDARTSRVLRKLEEARVHRRQDESGPGGRPPVL